VRIWSRSWWNAGTLKTKHKDVSPAAFIFGGRFAGPLDPSNFRKRVLHKLAEELEFRS